MTQFTEKEGSKDYGYLKDMMEGTDKVKKCLTGVTNSSLEPKRFKILRNSAKRNHNVEIVHAPSIIERHRQNISFFFVKTKEIFWVVELLFYRKNREDGSFSKVITLPTSENKSLEELVKAS